MRIPAIRILCAAAIAAAILSAPARTAESFPALGDLAGSKDPNVAKAARAALEKIAHNAARPGAEAERKDVAAQIAALTDPSRPAAVRRHALHLLSLVGGDAEVPAVARILNDADPRVREEARVALERIPEPAATKALIDALESAPAGFRPAIIESLGMRKAVEAIPALARVISGDDRAAIIAAVAAVSRIGEMPVDARQATIRWPDLTEREQAACLNAVIRLGHARLAKGDTQLAMLLFRGIASRAPADHLRCAAIGGLVAVGSRDALSGVLPALSDGSAPVRAAALDALAGLPSGDADAYLRESYSSATGPTKAALLRVLAARKAPGVADLVREATNAEDTELRVTAFHLSGGLDDPSLLPAITEAARSGSPQIREIALGSYLALANAHLAKGERDAALEMMTWALDQAPTSDLRRRALAGLASIGDPRSIEKVKPLMDQPETRTDAARAYVAAVAGLGKAGQKEKAIEMLLDVVGSTGSMEITDFAMAKLRDLGADTSVFAKRAGFITTWHIIGPFPSPNKSAFDRAFFPEEAIDLQKGGTFEGKAFAWKKVSTDQVPARIDLTQHLSPTDSMAAYGTCVLLSDRDRKVKFRIGSDDGCVFWLNGEKLHATNADRSFSLDQDLVVGSLRMGENRLLIKVLNGGGDWQFCVRITNPGNQPIDLSALEIRE